MTAKGTIIVTGANGALGVAIVGHITKRPELASNYVGVYTVRKAASATQLKKTLGRMPASHKHQAVDMDLGSIANVRKAAEDINRQVAEGQLPPIRALILNAGYQEHDTMSMSGDGYEMSWQVNYLANFILCLLLLQSMDKKHGRILIVGSWSHDVDDIRNEMGGTPYKDPKWHNLFPGPEELAKGRWSTPEDDPSAASGFRRYGASKLCATMLHQELGHRLARDPELGDVAVMALDPGGMASGLGRKGDFWLSVVLMKWLLPALGPVMVLWAPNGAVRTAWKSGGDVLRACFEVEVARGEVLYLNGTDEAEVAKDAKDEGKRRALWAYGIKAAGIRGGETALGEWE